MLDPLDIVGPQAGRVAITNVTVVPMTRPETVADQTVVVGSGRIVAMGPADDLPVPPDARVVDGRGRYLMPGLADMHAHYGDPGQFVMFLAGGVTTVRNMWGSPFHLETAALVADGRLPGPYINTTSPITDRPVVDGKGIYPGTALIEDPDDAAGLVASFAAAGYDAVKVYSYLTPDCLEAIGRAAAEHGLPMVGHCPTGMSFEEAMDAGMTSFEHLVELGRGHLHDGAMYPALDPTRKGSGFERMRLELERLDREAVRRLAAELAARDVWNCPTITVTAQFVKDPEEVLSSEAMQYLPTAAVEHWKRRAAGYRNSAGRVEGGLDLARRAVDLTIELTGLLHQEGAPILLGTDAGSPLTPQGFTVADELEYFSAAGLSWFDALSTATTAVARYLGRDDTGTVEVGKRADLLLVGTDPSLDPAGAARDLAAVLANGFLYERNDLDRLLAWRRATADAMASLPDDRVGPMATQGWYAR